MPRCPRSIGYLALLALIVFGACAAPGDSGPARPVILIVVDTLRADHLGTYGYERPTSPHLDAWALSGRLYERAHATAPWTAPSFGSLFTGELPSRHGVLRQERPDGRLLFGALDPGIETLAGRLGARGYKTAAFVNNPFLAPEFGLDRGFELYDYYPGNNSDIRVADAMVDRALGWIDAQSTSDFFVVLQLFDPHMDYDAPAPFRGRFTGGIESDLALPITDMNAIRNGEWILDDADRAFIAAAYDEEIRWVDEQLGRFRDALDTRGLLDTALIVLTADHGEELFDHGGFEHGHSLWQELIHVPFVVWGPGVTPGRDATPVTIADVAPTVLAFAQAEPLDDLAGLSLWPTLEDSTALPARTLYAEHNMYGTELKTAIRWPHKLIVNVEDGERFLFDLDTNPAERLLPWQGQRALADELTVDLAEQVGRDLARRAGSVPAELGEETLEKLRSLGYVH